MLVLTRRIGETIRIGDDIAVQILDVSRNQVRVAIDAPREIPVHRQEVYEQVQEENRRAAEATAQVDPTDLWRRSKKERS